MPNTNNPISGLHIVRYGTAADQKYLLNDFIDTYDQLVINANMITHMPAGIANFIDIKAKKKPFFIDPQTHAFQHDISYIRSTSKKKQNEKGEGKNEIKRPYRILSEEYGDPILNKIKKGVKIKPKDIEGKRRDFCQRVIDFQMDFLNNKIQGSDSGKYYDYLNETTGHEVNNVRPSLVVAPYFYMEINDEWLDENINCGIESKEIADRVNKPLGIQIAISKDLLVDDDLRDKVINKYIGETDPDVFLIWVDSFSEHSVSKYELKSFIEFIKRLSEEAPVVNLYGGYFSVLLKKCGIVENLVGVVHGLAYGEDRPLVPVGGGFPTAKFYFPRLHKRILFREAYLASKALKALKSRESYQKHICDCNECQNIINNDPERDFYSYGETQTIRYRQRGHFEVREIPTPATTAHCVKHYLWCKDKEYKEDVELIKYIDKNNEIAKILSGNVGSSAIAFTGKWNNALEEYLKK